MSYLPLAKGWGHGTSYSRIDILSKMRKRLEMFGAQSFQRQNRAKIVNSNLNSLTPSFPPDPGF